MYSFSDDDDPFNHDDDTFIDDCLIAKREEKKTPGLNWRKYIVYRKAARLKTEKIGVIGAKNTGRHTLVHRFVNMDHGPFDPERVGKSNSRNIVVDLSQISSIPENEAVRLDVRILNARSYSYGTFTQFLSELQIIAVVFDVTSERTLDIATTVMNRIRRDLEDVPKFILLGNKIDIAQDRNTGLGLSPITLMASNSGAARYYECSALMNINMDIVLEAILLLTFYPQTPL